MRNLKMSFLGLCILLLAACSGNKEAAHDEDSWPELDAFHEVMADAYHPLKDSSNLAPAKSGAEAMAVAAEKWAGSPLPSRIDNDDTRNKLAQLKTDTRTFADRVAAGAPDEELSSSLEKLHDSFHGIMEDWHKSGREKSGH